MALLLTHAATALAMTGLIWFVQLVHYPLFSYASPDRFRAFAAEHQRRTTWVVLAPMLVEAVSATLLLAAAPGPATWTGWLLLVGIWLSTCFVQVPLHRRLAAGYDPHASSKLVRTNWLRTGGWTARAAIALFLVAAG